MTQPLGQVMVDLIGTTLTDDEAQMLQHPWVGGVILFTRNYENNEQLTKLVQDIRRARDPIIIAVDQEGGRVQRFKNEFSLLSPLADIGQHFESDPNKAKQLAIEHATTMANELKAHDIDLSFTPVLDVDYGISNVIGTRSFHQTPQVICDLAGDYILAMHNAHMPATGKHFPGHGGVSVDSHEALPVDVRDFESLFNTDMQPFRELANQLDAIMPAHIVFPAVDDKPVGFSHKWLSDILRGQFGFDGVIFSDCLTMKATESFGSYAERAKLAFDAGCDMVLVCNNPEGAREVLNAFDNVDPNPTSQKRLQKLKQY